MEARSQKRLKPKGKVDGAPRKAADAETCVQVLGLRAHMLVFEEPRKLFSQKGDGRSILRGLGGNPGVARESVVFFW